MSESNRGQKTTDVDRRVGLRIRQARLIAGLTMEALAERAGCSYQQINKYEMAINRVTAGRLADLATILAVHVGWFFDEPAELPARAPQGMAELVTIAAVLDNGARSRALAYAKGELDLQTRRAQVAA